MAVGQHLWQLCLYLKVQIESFVVCQWLELIDHLAQAASKLKRFLPDFDAVGLDFGEIQHIVNKVRKVFRPSYHKLDMLLLLSAKFTIDKAFQQERAIANDTV